MKRIESKLTCNLQFDLPWDTERIILSVNHVINLFGEARRFGPKRAFFSCKGTKQMLIDG